MTKQILVTYASISGSTAEVAEAIAKELTRGDADLNVTLKPIREVNSLSDYDGVVVGSSIRVGRWLPEAVTFIKRFRTALAGKQVAYFTTCLTMAQDTDENRRKVLAYMEPVHKLAPEVNLVGLGLFAGSLDPHNRVLVLPDLVKFSDYRSWDTIDAWANEIRAGLLADKVPDVAQEPAIALAGAILSYTDMSGLDLSDADMQEAQLSRSRLVEARLTGANLRESDLTEADLTGADLRNAGLFWAELYGANLSGTNMEGANLIGADITDGNLADCNAKQAIMNGVVLKRADLSNANLREADLNWSDLTSANLSGADLRGAHLNWANLNHANLTDVKLDGAFYNDQTHWPGDFDAAAAGCIFVREPA